MLVGFLARRQSVRDLMPRSVLKADHEPDESGLKQLTEEGRIVIQIMGLLTPQVGRIAVIDCEACQLSFNNVLAVMTD